MNKISLESQESSAPLNEVPGKMLDIIPEKFLPVQLADECGVNLDFGSVGETGLEIPPFIAGRIRCIISCIVQVQELDYLTDQVRGGAVEDAARLEFKVNDLSFQGFLQ
jgi:hypothetical protein